MLWQYRTILFEFTKNGLLGDKYVDDEDMEKTLNQLGRQSWELVDVSLLQDGVLAFLKRPSEITVDNPRRENFRPMESALQTSVNEPQAPVLTRESAVSHTENEPALGVPDLASPEPVKSAQKRAFDFVGDIRIS